MRLKYHLDACVDCIAFVANGDIPEDRPELANEIAEWLGADDARHLVNDDDGEEWFTWSGCECCNSRLGGNRNRLAVLTAD